MNHRLSKEIVIDLHHVNMKFGGANDAENLLIESSLPWGMISVRFTEKNEFFI